MTGTPTSYRYVGDWEALALMSKSTGLRNNCNIYSIVVEEHDSHHISLPPINPLVIVQAPAEDKDILTMSFKYYPFKKALGF